MRRHTNKYFDVYAPVFYPASIIILFFISLTLIIGKPMEEVFSKVQTGMADYAGWFFVISVNVFVAVALYLAFSRFQHIRLGGKDAKPEFSTFAWFSMLFSAGMGIGLLFFSVAEPIFHFTNPPIKAVDQAEQARNAMKYTLLHWGLHAWAIYALVGLALAFFTFNKKLPLTIRSVFYPLLGDRIYGIFGDIIDIVAVVATLFWLATSLGFGVQQVSAGLNHLFGLPDTTTAQVVLITLITLAATVSVVTGLHRGVRFLSEMNIRLGLVFLVVLLIIGPTVTLLDGFIQNTGSYLQSLFEVGTWTETYTQTQWQNSWTVVYWAWWISWSPFVGIFIARVSKGRTLREFVLGVMLVPTLLTILWFSVFGGSALFLEINGIGNIATAVNENISTALFVMLEEFPLAFVISIIGIVLVTSFFVTSSDSGSLVIDSITSGGKLDAPKGQRIFWALTEGAVAATLLLGGGLQALQTAALTTGLPFTIILLIMCYSLYLGLKMEYDEMERRRKLRERQSYEEVLKRLLARRKDKIT
jgi:choline/glycine/proline betaine transport protein